MIQVDESDIKTRYIEKKRSDIKATEITRIYIREREKAFSPNFRFRFRLYGKSGNSSMQKTRQLNLV